jgi:hypothetical protein
MKSIYIAYVPRLDKYEYQLVRVTPSGKVFPLSPWKSGSRDLESTKTAAVEQYGNLTISVS